MLHGISRQAFWGMVKAELARRVQKELEMNTVQELIDMLKGSPYEEKEEVV